MVKKKRDKKTKKTKFERYFLLDLKKIGLIILSWVLAVVLHNVVSGVLGVEEALFFIIAVLVIPVYLVVAIIYTLYRGVKK